MARHIFLIPGVDKEAMHIRAQMLINKEMEPQVIVHAHGYVAYGECNDDCVVYPRKALLNDETEARAS